jgi:hypothetical protein
MTKIVLSNLVGSYPLKIYISDVYGGNETYLGQVNSYFSGTTEYNLPLVFATAPQVTIKIIDSLNEFIERKLNCQFNCDLIVDISIVA